MIAHAQTTALDSWQNKEEPQNKTAIPLASSTNNELKITRLTQFSIPIQLNDHDKDSVVAVELLYSPNEGKNWHSCTKIDVTQEKFEFNAPSEGEYWFAFRTVSKNGSIKQIGKIPQARVRVDTTPPKLITSAKKNDSGEVVVEWIAEDLSLKSNNVAISLSYDSGTNWMALAADPKNTTTVGNRETGYAKFWPNHEAFSVEIRCELEDLAKNKEIFTTQLNLKNENKITNGDSRLALASTTESSNADATTAAAMTPPQPLVVPSYKPRQYTNDGFSATNVAPIPGTFVSPIASSGVSAAVNETIENELDNMLRSLGNAPQPVSARVMPRIANGVSANVSEKKDNQVLSASVQQPQVIAEVLASTNENGENSNIIPPNTAIISTENAEKNKPEIIFPGKIVSIEIATSFNNQPCILVRWVSGDAVFFGSKVDLYRSTTKYGPWRPIVFDLNNSGEYFWTITPVDESPFFLRIDLRSTQGAFTDFTSRAISIH
ncbi:MAG: hypothetical protein LBT05_10705 [Planctomycetaceae bacterium]|nr:hypothetical protein [Planctomycetaceae bacterium]